MDGIQFDSLARALHSPAARRSALGLLLGSTLGLLELTSSEAKGKKGKKITLCLNGQTLSVKKSKKGKLLKQGADQGAVCQFSARLTPSGIASTTRGEGLSPALHGQHPVPQRAVSNHCGL